MVKTFYLHGNLGKIFGREHKLDVSCVAEAVRALCNLYPGFKENFKKGEYKITRGRKPMVLEDTVLSFSNETYHITPVINCRKKGGIFQIILGIVLIIVSIYFPPAGMAAGAAMGALEGVWVGGLMMGAAMVIGGVAQMLTPTPTMGDYSQRERPEERPSYLFNGPVNTMEQGNALPLIYGRIITGSTVIASELDIEQLT